MSFSSMLITTIIAKIMLGSILTNSVHKTSNLGLLGNSSSYLYQHRCAHAHARNTPHHFSELELHASLSSVHYSKSN